MSSHQEHRGIGDNLHIQGDAFFNNSPQIPSSLSEVLNTLADIFYEEDDKETARLPKEYNPVEKISFNNVVEFEGIIQKYHIYYGKLNKLYTIYEKEGTNKKRIILQNLNTLYIRERDKLRRKLKISKSEVRKNHSDLILSNITEQLISDIKNSDNIDITVEEVRMYVNVIVVDGFIRCKILENPNQQE